jgi:hypothetical protein
MAQVGDEVAFSFDIRFYQNFTGLTLTNRTVWFNVTGAAPTFNGTLAASEFQNATSAIQEAIRALSPNATVSHFEFSVVASDRWVNISSSFIVTGIVTQAGDLRKTDFSWKGFTIAGNLTAANVTYNQYGRHYIRPLVSEIINQTRQVPNNFTFVSSTYFLSNQSVSDETALNRVGNTTLLDFSTIGSKLSTWTRTYFLENHTTVWTLEPGDALDLDIRTQVKPGNETYRFMANYAYNATLTMPGLAIADGDLAIVETGSGLRETVMVAVLVVLFAGAVVATVAHRSASKRIVKRR